MPATDETKTTTKAAKKPQDRKPSSKAKAGFGKKVTHMLDLPSGYTVEVKRPGVQGLMKAGILESLDSLTSIVQGETIPKAEGKPKTDIQKVMENPEQLKSMLGMLDKIVLFVTVSPKLSPKPIVHADPTDENSPIIDDPTHEQLDAVRDDDLAYVDLVDDDDKTFIMNFALGGSKDLSTFREATEEAVAGSLDGEAAEGASK